MRAFREKLDREEAEDKARYRLARIADRTGKSCARCGRDFAPGQPVLRGAANGHYGCSSKRASMQAPFCEACEPKLDPNRWSQQFPCAHCGRSMRYRLGNAGKPPICCSHHCGVARAQPPKPPSERTCFVCGQTFVAKRADATACSHKCRQRAYRERIPMVLR